jgi:hypothetical protein
MKSVSLTLLLISVISISTVSAQSSARIVAGVNLANVSVTPDGRINKAHELASFQVGIVADAHLGSILYLQPGILFTGKGSKVESDDPNSSDYYRATANPYYIEIPFNLVFKLPASGGNKVFFGVGPYAAIGVSGKNKVDGTFGLVSYHNESNIRFSNDDPTTMNQEEGAGFGILKRFDYGLNGIAGVEGKSLTVSVNYGLGLAKLQSGSNSSLDNDNKHRVISIALGIKL